MRRFTTVLTAVTACAGLTVAASTATAAAGSDHRHHDAAPKIDHLYVLMLENHSKSSVIDAPTLPT